MHAHTDTSSGRTLTPTDEGQLLGSLLALFSRQLAAGSRAAEATLRFGRGPTVEECWGMGGGGGGVSAGFSWMDARC